MLAAAPAPEDRRGGAVAAADAPAARGDGRRRLRGRPGLRLHRGGHRRVHRRGRPAGRVVLHGDEHPAAGRAPGHRGGHRARPRGAAAAGGGGGAAAADPGRRRAARARDRGPGLRRGPWQPGSCPPAAASSRCDEPRDLPGVRVDSGIAAGFVVGSDYDPMLSKIIAHGADRAEALHRLDAALRRTRAAGARHERRVPAGAARRPRRARGEPRHRPGRPPGRASWPRPDLPDDVVGLATGIALLDLEPARPGRRPVRHPRRLARRRARLDHPPGRRRRPRPGRGPLPGPRRRRPS